MERKRIIKFVAAVEVTREDWDGVKVVFPALGLVATDKTESGALDKMDSLISRQIEFGFTHGKLKIGK